MGSFMVGSLTRRATLGLAVSAALGTPHIARAATRAVRIGHNGLPGTTYDQGCRVLANAVAANPVLAPVLRIDIHGQAALGDDLTMVRACGEGTLDMVYMATTAAGNVAPPIGLLDTPFLFKSAVQARATLDGDIGAEFATLLQAKGPVVLAWGENGLRHITSNRPIRTPGDLAGLKLRVPQSEVELASFRALGAEPGPLPFGELRLALSTGRFEAQENPIAVIRDNKFNEVQKYLSLTGHIYSAAFVLASPDLMEDLTTSQRDALVACAKLAGIKTRQVAEAAERDGVAELTAAGMILVDHVDIPAFMAAARPSMGVFGAKYGPELMQRLVSAGA